MKTTDNLVRIKSLIAEYEQTYRRPNGAVCLLAASKGQPLEKLMQIYAAGQRDFGENYLQEALTKIAASNHPDIIWHFLGPIQRNKTRKIAEHFTWVHSVDNELIAKRLNEQRPEHLPPLNICLEVNVSDEPTKAGVQPNEVLALARYCLSLPRLRLRGLMAIPLAHENVELQRQEFKKLARLQQMLRDNQIDVDTLSMGMSNDFEAAIAEGATIVRIGTALFGSR